MIKNPAAEGESSSLPTEVGDGEWLDVFCARGYAVLDNFLPPTSAAAIESYERLLWSARDPSASEAEGSGYRPARVGRGNGQREERERSDWIRWLDESDREEFPFSAFFTAVEELREKLRTEAFLPLTREEFHSAVYEAGTFYRKHLDAFRDHDSGRLVSCAYYLNSNWTEADAGALRLHGVGAAGESVDVLPIFNRLVIFKSREISHEVLAPKRARFSLTGWLKVSAI